MALEKTVTSGKKSVSKEFKGIQSLMSAAKWLRYGKLSNNGKPIIGQENVYNFLKTQDEATQKEAIAYANQVMDAWVADKKTSQSRRGW